MGEKAGRFTDCYKETASFALKHQQSHKLGADVGSQVCSFIEL